MPGDFNVTKIVVSLTGGLGSPPDYNIHYVTTATQTETVLTPVVTQFKNFYDAIKAYYPNGTIITVGASVLDMEVTPPVFLPVPPQTVNGTDSSGFCPPQCAVVVSWRTLTASRGGRGRSYIGPVGRAAETTNGTPMPAFVTALQTAANALITGLTSVSASKVIYNETTKSQIGVTGAIVRGGTFHTQRRRAVK
jgi:hypothetical protein